MIDNTDNRTPYERFCDSVTEVIDGADDSLTVSQVVGCLELQLHVYKNRVTGYRQFEGEKTA